MSQRSEEILRARKQAMAVVEKVAPQPGKCWTVGDRKWCQAGIKREWLKGMRYLTTSDQLFVDYLHTNGQGQAANHLRIAGLNDTTDGNLLTAWAYNGLVGNPGRLPRT